MPAKASAKKNPPAVGLSRKGAKKRVTARAVKGTKATASRKQNIASKIDTSDEALLALLKRLKSSNKPSEIRSLSNQLERVVFHRQVKTA